MRILFTRFPLESVYGGAEVQTLSLMKGLRERGHDVRFLGSCAVLLKEAASFHLPASSLDIGKPPVTKWGAVSFLWRQRAMRKKLIEFFIPPHPNPLPRGEGKFDVICMLSLSEKLLITEWAVEHGIRVFWIEHDRVGRWLRWNPWLPRLRRLSRLATTVVVSDLSKRIYVELGWDPERIAVIPNGIDVQRFQNSDSRFQKDSRAQIPDSKNLERATSNEQRATLRVGTIARLSPEKGVDLLIEAVKDLPNIHLTIVGTGREEARLRQIAQPETSPSTELRTGNQQPVTFLPSVPDVGSFYRSLDLFILPSRDHDPCPLAPMEAMACGVPVIMTDACGTAEYVENGKEAIVVSAGSVEALRVAILEAASGERRAALSRCGLEAAQKKFSLERMIDQYEKLLGKIPSPI